MDTARRLSTGMRNDLALGGRTDLMHAKGSYTLTEGVVDVAWVALQVDVAKERAATSALGAQGAGSLGWMTQV